MTPRERVRAALSHRETDRAPFSWGFGPTAEMARELSAYLAAQGLSWDRLRAEVEEAFFVGPEYCGPPLPESTDIWGVRRRPVAYGRGTYHEIEHMPLANASSVAEVGRFPWPDPLAYDFMGMRARIEATDPHRLRATKLVAGNPFETYCWMTGLEESLSNLILQPAVVEAALDRITCFFEERLRACLTACGDQVDLLFFADDLGSQTGLLMSREMYRRLLQPYHRRLTALGRRLAPHARAMLHSDGSVFELLPDLMDAGVEVLEAVQTDAAGMDPERLKRAYGDRLSFHGGISVQQLLPRADEAGVESGCRRVVSVLGRGGGLVAAPSHAIQVGTPPANVLAMLRGVLGVGELETVLPHCRL